MSNIAYQVVRIFSSFLSRIVKRRITPKQSGINSDLITEFGFPSLVCTRPDTVAKWTEVVDDEKFFKLSISISGVA